MSSYDTTIEIPIRIFYLKRPQEKPVITHITFTDEKGNELSGMFVLAHYTDKDFYERYLKKLEELGD